jgi:hypothetical protein
VGCEIGEGEARLGCDEMLMACWGEADRFARRFQSNRLLEIGRLQRFLARGRSGATSTVSDEVNRSNRGGS